MLLAVRRTACASDDRLETSCAKNVSHDLRDGDTDVEEMFVVTSAALLSTILGARVCALQAKAARSCSDNLLATLSYMLALVDNLLTALSSVADRALSASLTPSSLTVTFSAS